ncbi:MAG: hypothetical protein WC678_04925 [Parcubacteria group bacterium]|jgi:chromosome segregation ATPase
MNYKKLSKISLVAFLTITFVFPSVSLAVGNAPSQEARDAKKAEIQEARDAKKEEVQENRSEKTCAMISNQAEQIQNRLTERIAKLTQKRTETQSNIAERVAQRTAKRTERRAKWEQTKTANWEKLQSKAQTDEQKAAVAKFIAIVQTAVKNKNDAVDAILTQLRAEIQTQNNERKSEIDAQIATYKNAVASITSQVQSDCSAGKDAKTIRESYRTQMKQARETFQNRERNREEFNAEIKTLKDAKKSEVRTILETFKKTVEDAKVELRSAFPATTE